MMEEERWEKEASEATYDTFLALLEEGEKILGREMEKRKGSGLVNIPSSVERVIVVGDIHGDLESLIHILKDVNVTNMGSEERIVFLGDYGDRGAKSVEVYYILLKLKVLLGERVIMLRGNHEGPPDIPVVPHDLPLFIKRKYKRKAKEIYEGIKRLWELLPFSAIIEGKYLMLHGGLPANVRSIEDIAYAHRSHPSLTNFEEILWSDPLDGEGYFYSARGAGRMFGWDVTDKVFSYIGVKTLIRSHEPCDGVVVRQRGRILTLFSRKGSPYFNKYAAYLILDKDCLRYAKDAYELVRGARLWQ
ncbi:MAG: metallophosphoesterase family protein [Candidatus Methanospirareceae archaeon]